MVENPYGFDNASSSAPKTRATRWLIATILVLLVTYASGYEVVSDSIVYTPPSMPRWIHRKFNSRVLATAYWPVVWSESNLRGLHIYATVEGGTLWTAPFYHVIPLWVYNC